MCICRPSQVGEGVQALPVARVSCYRADVQDWEAMSLMSNVSRNETRRGLWVAVCIAGTVSAGSAWAADEPIVEKLEHGQVDWSAQTVIATGSGAPNLKLENVAQIRLAAERAAKLDGYRKILESLKGVRITAKELGSAQISKIQVRAQVEGIIRGCKTVDTRYYSDGAVDIVLKCPLTGGLAMALVSAKTRVKVSTKGEAKYSGLIIDATEVGVKPALSPRITDEAGTPLYALEMISPNSLREHGVARFVRSVDIAKKDGRVGKTPLVIKALVLGAANTDIQISAEDAAKLTGGNLTFLAEGRVVIATAGL